MSKYKDLIYTKENQIAKITLNRPKTLNALTANTHRELRLAIEEVRSDDDVRVLILTGAGKGFCSGDDVKSLFLGEESTGTRISRDLRHFQLQQMQGIRVIQGGANELMTLNKPSIAAVNGPAVGYGCEIALLCDVRIASEAARFGLGVYLRMGLMPCEGLFLLPMIVGLGRAQELIYTGRIIDAQEAGRIGLANKVVPGDQLEKECMDLANEMLTCAPVSMTLSKELQRRGFDFQLQRFYEWYMPMFSFCSMTEDHREAAMAFVEKRAPKWKGK